MAYDDNEISVRGGKPRELYKFVGTYAKYFYTSGTKRVRYPNNDQGDWYEPITIDRSEVNAGTPEDDGLNFTVDLPVSAEVCRVYAFSDAPPDLDLFVFRYHTIDSVQPLWSGRVSDVGIEKGMVTFTAPSALTTALQNSVTDVLFQPPCNHTLYDARCKVAYEDYSLSADIMAIDDRLFTVDGLAALDGLLIGGEFVLASGERRMIVEQAGNVLTLNFALPYAKVGDTVTIAAGCDYAWAGDCASKFDNQINFGGFPFIPDENVFESGIEPGNVLADKTCIAECPTISFSVGIDWSMSVRPLCYPNQYEAKMPQASPIFPNGGFVKANAQIARPTIAPNTPSGGNFVLADVAGGFDVLDFGADGAVIMSFRWTNADASGPGGYEWTFYFEMSDTDRSFSFSHQFARACLPTGDDYPASVYVKDGKGNIIAQTPTVVYRTFPQGFGINY